MATACARCMTLPCTSGRARSWRSSGARVAARARCSAFSPAWIRRHRARSRYRGSRSPSRILNRNRFQEARLLPWLTVAENVGFGLATLSRRDRDRRVVDALARIGLGDYGERWPRELSGGQASVSPSPARSLRVLPSCFSMNRSLHLMPLLAWTLQRHLLELWAQTRPTMVLVTHDIDEAVALASRIVVIKPSPGRIRIGHRRRNAATTGTGCLGPSMTKRERPACSDDTLLKAPVNAHAV